MRTLLCLLFLAASAAAWSQTYPAKVVRVLVPTGPGSSPDVRARQIAAKLSEAFSQPFVVENRPGASGLIAAREVMRAPADGYTLFVALVNNSILDALKPDPCCRLGQELVPVSRLTVTPLVLVVNPDTGLASLRELIERSKAKPDAMTYASAGPGSITQLLGEWIKSASGARLLEVPYKAVGAEFPDVLSGHVAVAFLNPVVVAAPIAAGKLRALAMSGERRLDILREVPTFAEAGLPGIEALVWNGVFVTAGTPAPVIEALHREIVRGLSAPEVREQVLVTGSEIGADSPEEFSAFLRAEHAKWTRVIQDAGVKAE